MMNKHHCYADPNNWNHIEVWTDIIPILIIFYQKTSLIALSPHVIKGISVFLLLLS